MNFCTLICLWFWLSEKETELNVEVVRFPTRLSTEITEINIGSSCRSAFYMHDGSLLIGAFDGIHHYDTESGEPSKYDPVYEEVYAGIEHQKNIYILHIGEYETCHVVDWALKSHFLRLRLTMNQH